MDEANHPRASVPRLSKGKDETDAMGNEQHALPSDGAFVQGDVHRGRQEKERGRGGVRETIVNDVILALVQRAQDGDTEAFGKVYDAFFLPIYRYAAFRAPQELVEDLVSEVFVKAWEKLHQYKVRTDVPFGAWLFRIARHTIIDAYRTQRSFDEVPEEIADPDVLNRADASTKAKDLLKTVRRALAALPRRYREVLLLSYVSELSHVEIARTLRMTEGGVRILKFRALKKLSGLLPPDLKESA